MAPQRPKAQPKAAPRRRMVPKPPPTATPPKSKPPSKKSRGRATQQKYAGIHMPTSLPDGKALAIPGMVRVVTNQAITTRVACFFCPGGRSGTIGSVWTVTPGNGAAVMGSFAVTLPMLNLADDLGGPTSGRCIRGHIGITCNTPLLDRGGRVYVASLDARAALVGSPSALTNSQAGSFLDSITAFPSTRSMDATDFAKCRTFNSWVVNQQEYHDFGAWEGTLTADAHAAHWAIWPGQQPAARPMSLVAVIFEVPAKVQNYDVSFSASHYTRWPMYSALGVTMGDIPTADNKEVAAAHKQMEKAGRAPMGGSG